MSITLNELIGTNMPFFKPDTPGIFDGFENLDYPGPAFLPDGTNAIHGITKNGRVTSSLVVYATHDTTNEVRKVTLTWTSRYSDNEHTLTYAESWFRSESWFQPCLQADFVICGWNIPILTKKIDMLIKGMSIKTITLDQHNVFEFLYDDGKKITDEQMDAIVNHGNGQWTISLYKQ